MIKKKKNDCNRKMYEERKILKMECNQVISM